MPSSLNEFNGATIEGDIFKRKTFTSSASIQNNKPELIIIINSNYFGDYFNYHYEQESDCLQPIKIIFLLKITIP